MSSFGYKQGATLRAVKMAQQDGVTLQQLCRITGKSEYAIRSCQRRVGIKLKTEFKRNEWGSLKQKLVHMNTERYTAKEVSVMLNTSIYTIYSLGARHNCLFRKADYGSQKGTNYSIYGKTSKIQTLNS
jgi:hypothetical protein